MVRKPDLIMNVGCVAMEQLQSQLEWCQNDCQNNSWMVTEGSFLNKDFAFHINELHGVCISPLLKCVSMFLWMASCPSVL